MQNNSKLYPKIFSNQSIAAYVIALVAVSAYFSARAMALQFILFGFFEVIGFFYFSQQISGKWMLYSDKKFEKQLFRTSLILRLVWVVFAWFYFQWMTGDVYEFDASDSMNYHSKAEWIIDMFRTNNLKEYRKFLTEETDDAGYASYLALVYALTNSSIFIARVLKAVWGALTVLLIYRLANRHFGAEIARTAGVLCMCMPNLIYYCGLHLKETEMVFLCVLFVERADQMMLSRKFTTWEVMPILLIAASLFTLRTPLGIVAILSLVFTIVMSSTRVVSWGKRIAVGALAGVLVVTMMGNRIQEQSRELYDQVVGGDQRQNMEWRAKRENGNEFAKYASAAVFAPLIFTIPFPTMVDTPNQDNQRMIHGGNFVKNVLSYFVILAVIMIVLSGDWRNHMLPFSFMLGYLAVLVFSHFAQSERFHMPALPFELMFAVYGMMVARTKPRFKRLYLFWCAIMVVACIAWSWFKLAGRGMA